MRPYNDNPKFCSHNKINISKSEEGINMAVNMPSVSDDIKLQNLSRHVFAQARAQCDNALGELEKNKEELYAQAEMQCYEDAYNKIQKEKLRITREANEQVSRAQLEAKKSLTLRRSRIMEQVFADVRAKIAAFTVSDAYYSWLLECAENAVSALGGNADIYINASDTLHQARLQKDCGCEVHILDTKDDILGGVRAVDTASHRVFSDTLAQRMEEQKSEFLKISKLNIVG